ncbi:MAG: YfhO family protein [Bacteroidales bacterium]
MKKQSSSFLPHIFAVLLFILIPSLYFPPMFQGKALNQSDIRGYQGMAKEIEDYREETGEISLWTNSMFGGMPSYLILYPIPNNILLKVYKVFTFQSGRPVVHIFLYMLGFYILLMLFGVNPWLGIIGGIAYGFSSYFFIILEPGHITKAIALGWMPMIIGGVYYAFRRNMIIGGILTSIFVGLQLIANHLQITYYTFLIILIFIIFEIIEVVKKSDYSHFLKTSAILLFAVIISLSVNIVNIWSVMEYSEYSLRGPSELTKDSDDRTSGLDKSYATGWSYGVGETFNLLIPNFKGGASSILLADQDSKTFDYLARQSSPQNAAQIINQNAFFFTQYWGDQPGTSGPVYIGAIVVFLFVFGMFFLQGRVRWWLFTVVVFSILLAWGKNFMALTDFFLEYFPGYNKFRTVSMILVMTQLAMPLLGILAVNKLLFGEYTKKEFLKAFKYSLYIVGGITILFSLAPGISDLTSQKDQLLIDQGARDLVNVIREDRADLLRKDALRSLAFVLLGAGLIYLYFIKKLKSNLFLAALGLLILIDLWPVNKRYLNDDNFVNRTVSKTPYQPTAADVEILKDKDLSYRVFDLTQDPFSSSRASYFHKSIGGYHGAKMRRYQEVYDHHIKEGMDDDILDMLNARYVIQRDQTSGQPKAFRRPSALGNAWFVKEYEIVENADEEIEKLGEIDPAQLALVDKRYNQYLEGKNIGYDSTASITLMDYTPDRLVYNYTSNTTQLAVFSEIFYSKGWVATVNDEEVPHFRVDYILRGMVLDPGEGEIVFEFRPKPYYVGSKIAFAGSTLIVLMVIGAILYAIRLRREEKEEVVSE